MFGHICQSFRQCLASGRGGFSSAHSDEKDALSRYRCAAPDNRGGAGRVPTVENSNLDNCVTLSHTTLASCEWIQQNASKHGLTVISGCRRVDQEEKK